MGWFHRDSSREFSGTVVELRGQIDAAGLLDLLEGTSRGDQPLIVQQPVEWPGSST